MASFLHYGMVFQEDLNRAEVTVDSTIPLFTARDSIPDSSNSPVHSFAIVVLKESRSVKLSCAPG
jgi:hypothetical protein